jgi:hypothetical protein
VPLVIRKGILVTEGDDLFGAGCSDFAPADSAPNAFQSPATPSSRRRPRSTGSLGASSRRRSGGRGISGSSTSEGLACPFHPVEVMPLRATRWIVMASGDRSQGSANSGMGGHNDVGNNRRPGHACMPSAKPPFPWSSDHRRHRVECAGRPCPGNRLAPAHSWPPGTRRGGCRDLPPHPW